MATVRELLSSQSVDRMRELLGASPRKFREELFNRLGIKSKGGARGFRLSSQNDARAQKLLEMLTEGRPVPEEILSEIVRNYLYTRRDLLGDALDFFEVEHKQGLTDQDLDFLEDLPPERLESVQTHLAEHGHRAEDVDLYLRFMRMKS